MATETAIGALQVRLLGAFTVAVAGRPLPPASWRRKRVASLIKLLALEPSHRLHREQVLEALWPELDPDAADNNLRFTLHEARKRLRDAGADRQAFLAREGETLVLGPADTLAVDVDAFEQAAAAAWRSEDPALTTVALEQYPGDLLPEDRYEEWTESRRAALRAAYFSLLRRLAELHLKRGEAASAVAALERLVAAEPSDEAAHVRLMKVLARTGQGKRALAQYDLLVGLLEREVGAELEPATTRLRDDIAAGRYPPSRRAPTAAAPPSSPPLALPAPVDKLIGREREVAELHQLLSTARLVTLTGPGGVGKTRLALAVAHDVAFSFAGGAAFVDLAPLSDPESVLPAIAQALGVREEPRKPLLELLTATLSGQRTLLVLDNFEQVVDAAPVVSELLAGCSGLTVLATSRVRLRLSGEREYPLGPLALPDADGQRRGDRLLPVQIAATPAVALFVERSRAGKPTFELTEDNAEDVAAICRTLDGLPLALELAAAWAKLLPPAAMRARLTQGRLALTGGARDLPARQQTIRATIAWSHDLLTAAEQRLFRRLAVFVGGWTLEAASAVAAAVPDPDLDLLEGLRALVDQNLVVERPEVADEPRLGMLETIREFGLERLQASGEEAPVRRAHLAHLIGLAEEFFRVFYLPAQHPGADQSGWLDRIEAEHANLRAAFDWALEHDPEAAIRLAGALMWLWLYRGYLTEGWGWLAPALAHPAAKAPSYARARALQGAANVAQARGDVSRAEALYEQALAMRREIGDDHGVASTLGMLGQVVMRRGDIERAATLLEEGLARARELDHELIIGDTLNDLGYLAIEQGDLERAAALFEEALARVRATQDAAGISDNQLALGHAVRLQGNLDRATEFLEEALAGARKIGNRPSAAEALIELGYVALARDDSRQAAARLKEALTLYQDVGDRKGIAACLEVIGRLTGATNRPAHGARLLGAAERLRAEIGTPLPPSERADHERAVEAMQAALGARAFTTAWEAGRRMELEAALAEAAAVVTEVAGAPTHPTGVSAAETRVEGVA